MNASPSALDHSTRADLARTGLAWATWPADRATPVQAYAGLRAAGRRACLLESVEGPTQLSRYSFLGVDPSASFRAHAGSAHYASGDERRAVPGALLPALRSVTPRPIGPLPAELPPFVGGWVGWFAFEWVRELEPRIARAKHDVWDVPYATLERYDTVLAFDHAAQRVFVVTRCDGDERAYSRAQHHIEAVAHDALESHVDTSAPFRLCGELASTLPPGRFEHGVERLRAAIAAGEIFQAVLSQRFEQRFSGDAFTLYRALRVANPSPHMFFFEADGLTLCGSSPERLVSARDGRVESRPIAGTRPRGRSAREDERLADELCTDAKERAEHDMLVDLARNDLGRVARIGSVRVREHARLERFARVQHLVSRLDCELARDRDALDLLAASFPAGTVSGAPKVRALELLAEIEPETRGPYGGAFGYIDLHGNLDMTLSIRTFAARGGMLSVQAGAGVVFDSSPERERRETESKAAALLEAARLAGSAAFGAREGGS